MSKALGPVSRPQADEWCACSFSIGGHFCSLLACGATLPGVSPGHLSSVFDYRSPLT